MPQPKIYEFDDLMKWRGGSIGFAKIGAIRVLEPWAFQSATTDAPGTYYSGAPNVWTKIRRPRASGASTTPVSL